MQLWTGTIKRKRIFSSSFFFIYLEKVQNYMKKREVLYIHNNVSSIMALKCVLKFSKSFFFLLYISPFLYLSKTNLFRCKFTLLLVALIWLFKINTNIPHVYYIYIIFDIIIIRIVNVWNNYMWQNRNVLVKAIIILNIFRIKNKKIYKYYTLKLLLMTLWPIYFL